ncbi:MAG: NAD(P)H-dependent oxidoreductase [Candidatus Woesearchaeota archaeon]
MNSKILIIYAHPNKNGFCGEVLKQILKQNKNCEVLDLYSMKYDIILKNDELYSRNNRKVAKETKLLQEKIKQFEKFIFIYPNWWQNIPAILKGFIDRVFISDFAFKYVKGMPKGLLSGKAIVISTCGAPKFVSTIIKGNRAVKLITDDVLRYCGIKAKGFVIGSALNLNNKRKLEIEKVVTKALKFL